MISTVTALVLITMDLIKNFLFFFAPFFFISFFGGEYNHQKTVFRTLPSFTRRREWNFWRFNQHTWFKNSSSLLALLMILPSKISVICITYATLGKKQKENDWMQRLTGKKKRTEKRNKKNDNSKNNQEILLTKPFSITQSRRARQTHRIRELVHLQIQKIKN